MTDNIERRAGYRSSGLISRRRLFPYLVNRTFVAVRFIRRPDIINYLQEPDIIHDVFGHVPLLADPRFADYVQAYGEGGLRSLQFNAMHHLARLYWYTIEFGLLRHGDVLRA
jgi:phenylalanine-4-hydroxylase